MEGNAAYAPAGVPINTSGFINHSHLLAQLDKLFGHDFAPVEDQLHSVPSSSSSLADPVVAENDVPHLRKRARLDASTESSSAEAAMTGENEEVGEPTTSESALEDLRHENAHLRMMVQLLIKESALTRKLMQMMLLNAQMVSALEHNRANAQPASSSEASLSHAQ